MDSFITSFRSKANLNGMFALNSSIFRQVHSRRDIDVILFSRNERKNELRSCGFIFWCCCGLWPIKHQCWCQKLHATSTIQLSKPVRNFLAFSCPLLYILVSFTARCVGNITDVNLRQRVSSCYQQVQAQKAQRSALVKACVDPLVGGNFDDMP